MDGTKAPSSDRFPASFFSNLWPIIGQDPIQKVASFLRGHMLRKMKQTNTVLVSKMGCPTTFQQFRPIRLCNVAYKVILKTLDERLRP